MEILLIALAWTVGVILGVQATTHRWKDNARHPMRLLCHGKLYKVVELDSAKSWANLMIHKDQ
jgi:hypothetical protein